MGRGEHDVLRDISCGVVLDGALRLKSLQFLLRFRIVLLDEIPRAEVRSSCVCHKRGRHFTLVVAAILHRLRSLKL